MAASRFASAAFSSMGFLGERRSRSNSGKEG
jgi:hypothetical protein